MTELSPAAQSVLDAINKELDEAPWDLTFIAGSATSTATELSLVAAAAAAALRAAADQVVPDDPKEAMHFTNEAIRLNKQGIRRKLHAIADELEGQ